MRASIWSRTGVVTSAELGTMFYALTMTIKRCKFASFFAVAATLLPDF